MKPSDLRLGNIVNYKGEDIIIRAMDFDELHENPPVYFLHGRELEKYNPIRLTDEWHNKFGVKKDGFKNFEYDICPFGNKSRVLIFSGDYLYLRDMSGKDRTEDDLITIWNKDIKKEFYVHEWQNLYFALTGKELLITK